LKNFLHLAQAKGKIALLAASLPDAAVHLFDQKCSDLTKLHNDHIVCPKGRSECCKLTWHPDRLLLAISWRDGTVTFIALTDSGKLRYQKHTQSTDTSTPLILQWLLCGSKLVIGHSSGTFNFWQMQQASDLEVDWEPIQVCLSLPART
jgi:WD40 repeat protein